MGDSNSQFLQQAIEREQAVASLEAKIKDREQEIGRLKKELEKEHEKSRTNQKSILKKTASYESRSSLEVCSNCKVMEIKHSALKEEILRSEKEIEGLAIDNEKLQEHIFDMEQRIVGIDLEV